MTFHRLDDRTTRVHLQMEYEPESLTEKAGAALGVVGHRIQGDLERFKEFIEHRGGETGAWRGDVDRPPQQGEHQLGDRGGSPSQSLPSLGEPDFAGEHTQVDVRRRAAPEAPDESVPRGQAGMDKNRRNPSLTGGKGRSGRCGRPERPFRAGSLALKVPFATVSVPKGTFAAGHPMIGPHPGGNSSAMRRAISARSPARR